MAQLRDRAARTLDRTPPGLARFMSTNHGVTKLLRPLVNRLLPDRETAITVRSGAGQGLRLCILPRSEKYYWTGLHERALQQVLQQKLREGSVYWDVGAHIGFTSLIASRLVGPSGRVEAFEPFPPNQQRLTRSIELNGCTNVTVHPEALSSAGGQRSFFVHEASVMGSLIDGPARGTIEVPCATLDDMAQRLPRPDLVKIDVEGAELDVLLGGERLLAAERPSLVVEFTTTRLLGEARQLLPFYTAVRLDHNHWLFRSAPD
jgi:FkbM family methyltransferase